MTKINTFKKNHLVRLPKIIYGRYHSRIYVCMKLDLYYIFAFHKLLSSYATINIILKYENKRQSLLQYALK